jgi:hypothetical protein
LRPAQDARAGPGAQKVFLRDRFPLDHLP